jgi:hypothetical protein
MARRRLVDTELETTSGGPIDDADPTESPAVWRRFDELVDWDDNPRDNDDAAEFVADLIIEYGFAAPLSAWPDPKREGRERLIAGHTRKKSAKIVVDRYLKLVDTDPERLQQWHDGAIRLARTWRVPVRIRADLTLDQANELALADNKASEIATWKTAPLAALLRNMPDGRAALIGWDSAELSRLLGNGQPNPADVERATATLAERFTVPPFSVLDARQGYWKARKKAWIDLGLKSFMGRETTATFNTAKMVGEFRPKLLPRQKGNLPSARKREDGRLQRGDALGQPLETSAVQTTLSIFDPVLAEVAYRWFCPRGGKVLDPFAGGSVRGLVAMRLGLEYYGIDLRPEQIEANRYQTREIGERFAGEGGSVHWELGDSAEVLADPTKGWTGADLVFSCPPYMDLETYSDDPKDLSAMPRKEFWALYRRIIRAACDRLSDDRFAVWVVGEVRDTSSGVYRSFVPGTIKAFEDAGLSYYNEAVLLTSLNSVPLRAAKQFSAGRTLCRTHQTVLVFLKGNRKRAVEACGDISHCMPDDLSAFVDGGPDEEG